MPELPEVETVVRDLQAAIQGQAIKRLRVNDSRVLVQQDFAPRKLSGQRIEAVERRGKYIVYRLGDLAMVQHLRMTGLMLPATSAAIPVALQQQPRSPKFRFWLEFSGGPDFVFYDVRRFGTLDLVLNLSDYFLARDIGPDLINDPAAAWGEFERRLSQTQRPIKSALLDQAIACGVGNIYADEALHRAGIHPQRPAKSLSAAERRAVFDAATGIMRQAIALRGTSMSDYLDVNGNPGIFAQFLSVYDRKGQTCKTCRRDAVSVVRLAGRSSHFCPRCQAIKPTRRR